MRWQGSCRQRVVDSTPKTPSLASFNWVDCATGTETPKPVKGYVVITQFLDGTMKYTFDNFLTTADVEELFRRAGSSPVPEMPTVEELAACPERTAPPRPGGDATAPARCAHNARGAP